MIQWGPHVTPSSMNAFHHSSSSLSEYCTSCCLLCKQKCSSVSSWIWSRLHTSGLKCSFIGNARNSQNQILYWGFHIAFSFTRCKQSCASSVTSHLLMGLLLWRRNLATSGWLQIDPIRVSIVAGNVISNKNMTLYSSWFTGSFQGSIFAIYSGKSNRRTRKDPNQCGSSGRLKCGSRTCWQAGKHYTMRWTLMIAGRSTTPAKCDLTWKLT